MLLVGETGTGKTTACQLAAFARRQRLHIINCNQHTESADFLGGYRPNRRRERAVGDFRDALEAFNTLSTSELVTVDVVNPSAIMQAAEAVERIVSSSEPDGHLQALAANISTLAAAACAPFEWADGPLVEAMVNGDMLLIDELNLAEDAVLERLNR